jgi:hypothetical protein
MGKYSSFTRQERKSRNRELHPIARGIGCFLIIIVPIMSYFASILLVNNWALLHPLIPPDWWGTPSIHPVLWKVQGLKPLLGFYQAQTNLEAYLAITIVIIIVMGGILTMVYGYIYKIAGPPQYGPMDAPPIRRKVKRYKR